MAGIVILSTVRASSGHRLLDLNPAAGLRAAQVEDDSQHAPLKR